MALPHPSRRHPPPTCHARPHSSRMHARADNRADATIPRRVGSCWAGGLRRGADKRHTWQCACVQRCSAAGLRRTSSASFPRLSLCCSATGRGGAAGSGAGGGGGAGAGCDDCFSSSTYERFCPGGAAGGVGGCAVGGPGASRNALHALRARSARAPPQGRGVDARRQARTWQAPAAPADLPPQAPACWPPLHWRPRQALQVPARPAPCRLRSPLPLSSGSRLQQAGRQGRPGSHPGLPTCRRCGLGLPRREIPAARSSARPGRLCWAVA